MEPKQKRIFSLWARTLFGGIVLGLGGGLLLQFGDALPLWALLLVLSGLILLAYPLTLPIWRALDEMAQQAHLVSWFWGGSLGGGVVLIGALALAERGEAPVELFHGALALMLAQVVAYTLVWAGWWLTKRARAS